MSECLINYKYECPRGSNRIVVDENGNIEQVNHYYPYGGLIGNLSTNPDKQKFKYNGKEYETMHGLNTYDYGARQYDPARITWDRMDPLCEKYYHINPYVYCAGNPVKNIDVNGLYPHDILKLHKTRFYRANYYTFTKPAAHLLSLVSGVDATAIENVNILERGLGRLYPLYNANKGGGAITLGSDKNNATITLTNNYFNDDKHAYNNHGYGQNLFQWFYLMSHEVVHLNHVEQQGNSLLYVISFGLDYLQNGHDNTEREKEADKSSTTFNTFNQFVNDNYGNNALMNLLKSNKNVNEQIKMLDRWWQEYQNSQK